MIDKTRELALKNLYKIDKEEAYSNLVLNQSIQENKKNLTPKDIGLLSELTYGVTTWKLTLDVIIQKYSSIKMKKISPWILNILRMGAYQIIFLDKIPKQAAVNESVELAKRYGHKASSNFVNAILRKIEKTDYDELKQIKEPVERISKTTSMPEWIVEHLLKEGKNENDVQKICENLNERPVTTIRRNRLKISKEELEQELQKQKIDYINLERNNDFYQIKNIRNIENWQIFKDGKITVQDLSAGLASYYLEPKEGEFILDACSAPGGKTTYIAELMNNKGKIEAWDIHQQRTNLVNENAKRLGITIIDVNQNDATIYHEEYKEKFDKILLDVPCLGIGVIKRKPDIKWQRSENDIEIITNIQKQILENCSKYLKVNGTIIYSTCSILAEENKNVVDEFIKTHPEYKIEVINEVKKCYLEIMPSDIQDGFFIAKIKRIK